MAMAGKYVKKTVPKTTNNITQAIVNHLLSNGHSGSRVNVQGQYDKITERYRPSGSRKGVSDIVGSLRSRFTIDLFGHPLGVALFIEVKIKSKRYKDVQSEEQIEFMNEVRKTGGIYYLAHDYETYLDWYNNVLTPQYL